MKITVQDVTYNFDANKVRNDEAQAIERALGCSWDAFGQQLKDGWVGATTALVWLLRRRSEPSLRIGDVCFEIGDFNVELEPGDPGYKAPEGEGQEPVDPTESPAASTPDESVTSSPSPTTSESDPGSGTG